MRIKACIQKKKEQNKSHYPTVGDTTCFSALYPMRMRSPLFWLYGVAYNKYFLIKVNKVSKVNTVTIPNKPTKPTKPTKPNEPNEPS